MSNAIYSLEKIENYLKKNNIKNESTLNTILGKVNTELTKKENTNSLGSTKKQKGHAQKKTLLQTKNLLEEKIKSIGTDAKAAVSSVNDVSATTSSQALVNIDDEKKQAHAQPAEHVPEESAKLKAQPSNTQEQQGDQQDSLPLSPQSSASGNVEGTKASANAAVTTPEEARSLVSDGEHDKIVSKEHQDDALEKDFSSDDGNSPLGDPVPTSTNEISGRTDGTQNKEASFSAQNDLKNKSATVLSVDSDEEKQASLSDEVFYDAEESMLGTTNSRDGSTLEGDSDKQESQPKSVPTPLVARDDECSSISSDASDASTIKAVGDFEDKQPNSSPLLPQSSVSGDEHSGSSPSFINVPTSDEGDTDNSEVSSEDITKEDSSGRLAGEGNQQNSQPPLPSFDLSSLQRWFVDDAVSSIAGDSHSEAFIEDDMSSLGIADDEYSEVSSIVSEKPLIIGVTDEEEPLPSTAEPDFTLKSNNSPQSTKSSKLPTVAIWTLAVAGILAGVAVPVAYFAFGASLLVAGITAGVGAWCLVAAAIIYCFNRPASSVENSNVETVKTDGLTA